MKSRLDRLRRQMDAGDLGAVLIGPGADLRWAVGYHAHVMERLTMLVVPAGADAVLVVPELEAPRARASGATDHVDLATFTEVADPVEVVAGILARSGHADARLAVQDRLWTQFTLALQAALPDATWVPGSLATGPLRLVKDAAEVAALRAVATAIDEVHAQVPGLLAPGRTEAGVAADIDQLIRATHDETSFVIVASGPNGASPHHASSDRVLATGDPVVVDIGGTLDGYGSDETRNYVLGRIDPAYQELHDVLEQAQAAASAAVAPGARAHDIDAAARDVITAAGHGPHFVHRTGHGIGLDGHEEPWIVAGNDLQVTAGMAFSIEPGIYVPDTHGARIEDIVVVTEDGMESLNHRPRGITVA